jgi:hypothetical protein
MGRTQSTISLRFYSCSAGCKVLKDSSSTALESLDRLQSLVLLISFIENPSSFNVVNRSASILLYLVAWGSPVLAGLPTLLTLGPISSFSLETQLLSAF